jgi:monoterpene epsilon-lactone hydrolase
MTLPADISPEAQAYLRSAVAPEPRQLTLDAIAERRRANYAIYAPAGQAVAASLGVTCEAEEIAGVRVQCVRPADAPEADGPQAGAVLYFFGGGYVEGSPDEDLAITARLAAALGRPIYVPYYRLAPEHPAPAALGDALAVYRALLARGPADALAVAGESAGGGLAMSLLVEAGAAGLAMPAALALLSPWVDLSKTGDSLTLLADVAPFMNYDLTLKAAAESYAGGQDLRSPAVSPLYATLPAGFPPTLITSATRDAFLSDCARLSTKMRQAGIAAELRVWEGLWHVFEYYPEIPEGRASLDEVAAYIDRHLAG